MNSGGDFLFRILLPKLVRGHFSWNNLKIIDLMLSFGVGGFSSEQLAWTHVQNAVLKGCDAWDWIDVDVWLTADHLAFELKKIIRNHFK